MIQLKIKNYTAEELETLEQCIAHALISVPCDCYKGGFCKGKRCENYKVCNDLQNAHDFICKALKLPF